MAKRFFALFLVISFLLPSGQQCPCFADLRDTLRNSDTTSPALLEDSDGEIGQAALATMTASASPDLASVTVTVPAIVDQTVWQQFMELLAQILRLMQGSFLPPGVVPGDVPGTSDSAASAPAAPSDDSSVSEGEDEDDSGDAPAASGKPHKPSKQGNSGSATHSKPHKQKPSKKPKKDPKPHFSDARETYESNQKKDKERKEKEKKEKNKKEHYSDGKDLYENPVKKPIGFCPVKPQPVMKPKKD